MSIYQSVWTNGGCSGPPTSMFMFDALDNYAPNSYVWLSNDASGNGGYCGIAPIRMSDNCCYKSLDNSASGPGFASLLWSPPTDISDTEFSRWTPKAAIGVSYCILTFTGSVSNVTRYLLDDGTCQDSYLSCFGGVLSIYDGTNACAGGIVETYNSSAYGTSSSALMAGNITVDHTTISNGNQIPYWIVQLPYNLDVIYLDSHFRNFQAVCIASAVLCSVYGLVYYLWKLFTSFALLNVGLGFVHALSILTSASMVISAFTPITNNATSILLTETASTAKVFTTLMILLFNLHSAMRVIASPWSDTLLKRGLIYGGVVTIHILTSWSAYNRIDTLADWVYVWEYDTVPIWFMFSIIFNNGALVYILWMFLLRDFRRSGQEKGSRFAVLKFGMKYQKTRLIMGTVAICLTLYYILMMVPDYYSNIAQGDASILMVDILAWCAFPWSGLLSIFIIDNVTGHVRRKSTKRSMARPSTTKRNSNVVSSLSPTVST